MRWFAAVVALVPATAHADITDTQSLIIEALIPDVRYEHSFTKDSDRYVLSLPVAWHAGAVALGTDWGFGFVHVGEAQWQGTHNQWRGLLGERVLLELGTRLKGFAPLVEVSGIVGQDGYGAVLGTGIGWGYGGAGVILGVIGRYVITNEERRMDFALDLALPLNILDDLNVQ